MCTGPEEGLERVSRSLVWFGCQAQRFKEALRKPRNYNGFSRSNPRSTA